MKASLPYSKSLPQTPTSDKKFPSKLAPGVAFAGGVLFTFLIALISLGMAQLPIIGQLGPLAFSILLAVIYRQFFGYPQALRPGIQFSSKRLLRIAIILYGLKLNVDTILHQGTGLILRDIGTVAFSILLMLLLAKLLKADRTTSLLLGVGTGVCGAAAIAVISPIIKSEEGDTAVSVGIIAFIGTIFAIGYTLILPFLPITAEQFGIWVGISLHEVAHVALAGAAGGEDALTLAFLAKLGRVFLLIPLSFLFLYWINKKQPSGNNQAKIEYPWFLAGFVCMSFVGTYLLGSHVPVSDQLLSFINKATTFILAMAMVGLGLQVNIKELRRKALRPLVAVSITSLFLSVLTYFTV